MSATDLPSDGEARKRAALDLLERTRQVLVRRARRALLRALLDRGRATIDPIRDMVPIPAAINPKLFGVVPGALAEAGLIQAVQAAKTRRPEAHARWVTVWELVDRAGALAWLETNPDLPDPDGAPAPLPRDPRQRDLFS
jgi:hypothetical protein